MKWLKRFFWLLAWGTWTWLGFGLCRELPRHEGAALHQLAFAEQEYPLAFFASGDRLASVIQAQNDPENKTVRVWDVGRGKVLRELALAKTPGWYLHFSARHGVLYDEIPAASPAAGRLGALDLETGRWTELAAKGATFVQFHPERPWVLLSLDGADGSSEVVVVDVTTGRRVFARKRTEPNDGRRWDVGAPLFLPKETLLIQTHAGGRRGEPSRFTLERWKISTASEDPERVFEGVALGDELGVSATGLVVWTELFTDPTSAKVFDADRGVVVSSFPPDAKPPKEGGRDFMGQVPRAILSADGRTVCFEGTLWDVARRTPIWTPGAYERPYYQLNAKALSVQEDWSGPFGDWAEDLATVAIRDPSSGRVLFRRWLSDAMTDEDESQIDRRRGVAIDSRGGLRPYPPPPNWPLLAFCQTLLAWPLVLLWIVPRWRRRLRLRRLGSAS